MPITRSMFVLGAMGMLAACGDGGGSAAHCQNDGDQAVFDQLAIDTGEDGAGAVSEAATTCGLSQDCQGALGTVVAQDIPANRAALSSCVESCLVTETGLTNACAGCYGDVTACSAGACAGSCISDSGSTECRACVETECLAAFGNCI